MTTTSERAKAVLPRFSPLLVFALALLGSWPLITNSGYFSHDELQWAARAGVAGPIPWLSWTAIDAFQYRPLTFNLWLWLSRHLFAHPIAFHALLVAWGAGNAALLCALGRRFGLAPGPAIVGALVFALGPYAAYVHGWIGTLGDIGWLCCALLLGCAMSWRPRIAVTVLVAGVFTALGLLFKEAAVSIPALLALAWWLDGRKRHWLAAMLASAGVVVIYLGLRIGVLLNAPREGGQYALSLAHVPLRWFEYQVFAPIPNVFESFTVLSSGVGKRVAVAALLWLVLLVVTWRSHRRAAAIFLLGGIVALAPVLPLASSWNHYGYGFAAITAMAVAAAWPHAPRWGRGVIGVVAGLCVLHGIGVMLVMRQVGQVQSVFSPALAAAMQRHPGATVLLRPAPGAREWIFVRLTHDIPSYRGTPIGNRVQLVDGAMPADYLIAADGSLQPLR